MGKRVFRSLALTALLGTAMGLSAPAPAEATLMWADVVIGTSFGGTPYGGSYPFGGFPVPVDPCVVLGPEPGCLAAGFPAGTVDFLSLPDGWGIDVGFTDETIYDGPGADFRVYETETGAFETARIYFSTDFGVNFTLIGNFSGTAAIDLAPYGLGGVGVNAIRVVGSGDGGASPGYDLQGIEALNVPEPGTLSLIGLGLAGLVARRRRQRS